MAQDAPAIDPTSSSSVDERTRSAAPTDAEVLRALMGALKPPARSDEPTCEPPPLGSKAAGSARRRRLGGGVCARADARHARLVSHARAISVSLSLSARRLQRICSRAACRSLARKRSAPEPRAARALGAAHRALRALHFGAWRPRAARARSGAARRAQAQALWRTPRGRRLLRPPAQAELQRLGLLRRRRVVPRGVAPPAPRGGRRAGHRADAGERRAVRRGGLLRGALQRDARRAPRARRPRARRARARGRRGPRARALRRRREEPVRVAARDAPAPRAAARGRRVAQDLVRVFRARAVAFRRRGARRRGRGARRALQRRPAVERQVPRAARAREGRARAAHNRRARDREVRRRRAKRSRVGTRDRKRPRHGAPGVWARARSG